MKLMLIFGFYALNPLFQLSLAETQVKVLDFITDFFNTSYVSTSPADQQVIKVNETYNRVHIKAQLLKEFPLDTQYDVIVARSKNEQGPWMKLSEFHTYICRNGPKRKYLPYNLINMSRIDGTSCVQKGYYEYEDAGIFKFYEILPIEKNYYYESINILRSNRITISATRIRSRSIDI